MTEARSDAASSLAGLTSQDASSRLARDGPNRLPPPARPSSLRRLAAGMVHFFALMLWVAAGLALLGGLPQLTVAISIVIVLNAGFAFVQESRADRAADRLRDLLPRRITVRRDGVPVDVDATAVCEGDLLLLESGDRVPADASIVAARSLLVDSSVLTGESEPARVEHGAPLFAGTFIAEGEAEAVVTAIGAATRLASIARLITVVPKHASPLTREMHLVVRAIAVIAVAVGVLFWTASVLVGNPSSDAITFSIGVTVALVPEALLPTVTLSLAWGAEQMARRGVLVRHLDAVETLGSTTFICTDKTGTLTCNQMTVVTAWTPAGSATVSEPGYAPDAAVALSSSGARAPIERLARAAARCSSGYAFHEDGQWHAHGDPTEAALDVFARRLGLSGVAHADRTTPDVRFPFDPRRRRMAVVTDTDVLVKGAPDALLPLCPPDDAAATALEHLAGLGLRVLAVAGRPRTGAAPATIDEAEHGLELYGLVAMEDPPRGDVADAISTCRRAGIRVAMVTGDHPATAVTIASEVGLRGPDDPVLLGDQLPDDDQLLGAMVDRDGVVIARVSPEDKLRIARALRARGHVVAMTGDGVNDGPALHEADIGVAMGRSGTDVAREAADLVLLDDHFASIVAGIEQGRATYVNVRRFLTYHLTDNVAELTPFVVWALSGSEFPLALGVLQILALDIGTDTLSAIALGAEPPARHLTEGAPAAGRLLNRTVVRRAFGVLGPTVAFFTMIAFVVSLVGAGWSPGEAAPTGHALAAASGAAFMTVVLAQTANAFACRSSTRTPGALGWRTNRLLILAASIELGFALAVIFVSPVADELGHASPPLAGWAVAVLSMGAVLAADGFDKRQRQRNRTRSR